MQHDGEWRNALRFHVAVHKKSLAVPCHVVAVNVGGRDRRASMKLKKRRGRARGKRTYGADRYPGQHAHRPEVENFFAVPPPARLSAAAARDLPLPGRARKRSHVDFPIAGFVRGIGDEFPIRRNHSIGLITWASLKRGRTSTAGRYHLQVVARRALMRE